MFKHFLALASVVSLSSVAGCAVDPSSSLDEEEAAVDSEEALSASANNGYYVVTRQDNRKCISPLCGGVYVKRANESKTRCADGTYQAECYVATYDFGPTGLDANESTEFQSYFTSGKALVRATMKYTRFNGTKLGKLRVTEAWKGAGEATVSGTFYRVADNGTRCITTPCPSTTAYTLNSRDEHTVVRVDLEGVAASPSESMAAQSALGTSAGILVSGGLALPKCAAGAKDCGPFVTADEFYLRVVHQTGPTVGACGVRGGVQCKATEFCSFPLSAQCGAADHPGKCAVRPEMCTMLYQPVCGCDGKSYSNSCMAAIAGVSAASSGLCTK